MANAPPALTAKQSKFVAEYLVDGNGTRAAVAAGYGRAGARVRAHRLTRDNEAVRAVIAARQGVDSQRLQIERQHVIAGLLGAVDMARAQGNAAGLISGWSAIARLLGLFAPEARRVEVSSSAAAEREKLEAMSDEELAALIAGGGGSD